MRHILRKKNDRGVRHDVITYVLLPFVGGQAACRDGGYPQGTARPDGHQARSGAGDCSLPQAVGGWREQVRASGARNERVIYIAALVLSNMAHVNHVRFASSFWHVRLHSTRKVVAFTRDKLKRKYWSLTLTKDYYWHVMYNVMLSFQCIVNYIIALVNYVHVGSSIMCMYMYMFCASQ